MRDTTDYGRPGVPLAGLAYIVLVVFLVLVIIGLGVYAFGLRTEIAVKDAIIQDASQRLEEAYMLIEEWGTAAQECQEALMETLPTPAPPTNPSS